MKHKKEIRKNVWNRKIKPFQIFFLRSFCSEFGIMNHIYSRLLIYPSVLSHRNAISMFCCPNMFIFQQIINLCAVPIYMYICERKSIPQLFDPDKKGFHTIVHNWRSFTLVSFSFPSSIFCRIRKMCNTINSRPDAEKCYIKHAFSHIYYTVHINISCAWSWSLFQYWCMLQQHLRVTFDNFFFVYINIWFRFFISLFFPFVFFVFATMFFFCSYPSFQFAFHSQKLH